MKEEYIFEVYVLSPVRQITEEQKTFLLDFSDKMYEKNIKAYLPFDNTFQDIDMDVIFKQNSNAIRRAKKIYVYWTGADGGKIDFGMIYMLNELVGEKPIILLNSNDVKRTEGKSIENLLLDFHEKYKSQSDITSDF